MKRILFLVFLSLSSSAWCSDDYMSMEINCLAQNIYYEAAGESTEGKIAVGQVTMNRLNDSRFPKSVCKVVKQKAYLPERKEWVCQFSWVCAPKKEIVYQDAWTEAQEIARNLYMGVIEGFQQLQGVFFFHAREVYIPKEWEPNHKVVMKIGNHVFYNRKES